MIEASGSDWPVGSRGWSDRDACQGHQSDSQRLEYERARREEPINDQNCGNDRDFLADWNWPSVAKGMPWNKLDHLIP